MARTIAQKTTFTCPCPLQSGHHYLRRTSGHKNALNYSHTYMRHVVVMGSGGEEVVEVQTETVGQQDICKTCGVAKNEMAYGCDGSGRIMGGIGAVPGFGWWPIKAYRPCGKAVDAGVTYQRKGQGVDEVMFGRK